MNLKKIVFIMSAILFMSNILSFWQIVKSLSTFDQFKCFQMITFCLFCHQMPCCWLCTINRFLSFMKTRSNNVSHLSAQMWWQIQMYLYFLETIHHKINIFPKTDKSYFQDRGDYFAILCQLFRIVKVLENKSCLAPRMIDYSEHPLQSTWQPLSGLMKRTSRLFIS